MSFSHLAYLQQFLWFIPIGLAGALKVHLRFLSGERQVFLRRMPAAGPDCGKREDMPL